MLTELQISNLGVIEYAELVLGPGLTVFTGETGAGKTMLLSAIELLVGARAESFVVRPGASEARVEGRFVVGDDEHVVARVVPVEGRSRAYLDGRPATAGQLAELGARIVDIHGQHAHQSLLSTAVQRAALDRFGGVDLGPLDAAKAALSSIERALAAMGGDDRARAREIDLLRFQVEELDAAELTDADEDDRLDAEEQLLSSATEHRLAGAAAGEALSADGGALDTLRTALAALANRPPFEELRRRLSSSVAELDDVAGELRSLTDSLEEDPERLDAVTARRQLFRELRRKYGDQLADVIAFRDEVADRLAELESHDRRAAELDAERREALEVIARAAKVVGAARRAAAPALADAVARRLHDLAMAKARVEIVVGADPGEDVEFLLAANPGEPALPLAKVASGGELARSMLALRLVISEAPDTLVFDEVDAGIGGSAANAVGAALQELGARHQVLVVTHLAQVAARADQHVVLVKREVDGRTRTELTSVRDHERVREISRMLSGDSESAAALGHARELLQRSGTGQ